MRQEIAERISLGYSQLSPQERRAADVVMERLDDLAVYSSAELAEEAGVSRATFSRLYRRLGFDSSHQVKELARMRRARGVPVALAHDRTGDAAGTQDFGSHLADELNNLSAVFDPERARLLEEAAQAISCARRVLVVGWRNSYPVALHLRTQLQQAREDVRLAPVPGQSLAEEFADLDDRDLVVMIGFRRRPRQFDDALTGCTLAGVPVLLLADGSARAYASSARIWVECPIARAGAFDSYAAAHSLVAWLADAVLEQGAQGSASRVDRATELFDAFQELEQL